MIGSKFGLWTVEREAAEQEKIKNHKSRSYICICECGGRYAVRGDQLNRGRSKGCKECYAKRFKKNVTKHNLHTSSTYSIWRGIKKRCNLPSHPSYRWYGAEGISYDPKWERFEGFLEDMGERPGDMTIDRIDSALNYTKENCRWVSIQENLKNRRAMKERINKRSTCECGVKIAKYYATQCWSCYSKTRLLEQKKDEKTGRFKKILNVNPT